VQIQKRLVVLFAVHVFAYILATGAPVLAVQVTLFWENPNTLAVVGGYNLHYWQSTWNTAVSVDVGDQTSYTLTDLENGQTYRFAITAYSPDKKEESAYSNEIVVTVSADSPPAPLPTPRLPSSASDIITIEAEVMTLTGYDIQRNTAASDEQLISKRSGSGAPGQATAIFPGPAGTYEVVVAYFDESNGQSRLEVSIDGVVVDTWMADVDPPAAVADDVTLTHRVITQRITLVPGQVIELKGSQHGGEPAGIDKVEFIPVRR
jgi:Fibronectin type III domain